MNTRTIIHVPDPDHDDGSTVEVDLRNPPDWLDVHALYAEAREHGDTKLAELISWVWRSGPDGAQGPLGVVIQPSVEQLVAFERLRWRWMRRR